MYWGVLCHCETWTVKDRTHSREKHTVLELMAPKASGETQHSCLYLPLLWTGLQHFCWIHLSLILWRCEVVQWGYLWWGPWGKPSWHPLPRQPIKNKISFLHGDSQNSLEKASEVKDLDSFTIVINTTDCINMSYEWLQQCRW